MWGNSKTLLKWGIVGIIFAGFFVQPATIKAACTVDSRGGPSSCSGVGCEDKCTTVSATSSHGISYYSCGQYCWLRDGYGKCVSYGQGCYWNEYSCGTACGLSVIPGGGGGYICDWSQANCPPGFVKDLTSYSDYCGEITGCPNPGSAQDRIAPGCGGTYCGDQKCTININGVEKCKCLQWNYRRQTIRTYGCVPTAPVCTPASPTAPTLSSPANGASLVDIAVDLIWNSTNFGTACTAPYSQYQIYLDQNNPPTTLIGTVAGGGKV